MGEGYGGSGEGVVADGGGSGFRPGGCRRRRLRRGEGRIRGRRRVGRIAALAGPEQQHGGDEAEPLERVVHGAFPGWMLASVPAIRDAAHAGR